MARGHKSTCATERGTDSIESKSTGSGEKTEYTQELKGHSSEVNSVAFSHNRNILSHIFAFRLPGNSISPIVFDQPHKTGSTAPHFAGFGDDSSVRGTRREAVSFYAFHQPLQCSKCSMDRARYFARIELSTCNIYYMYTL